MIIKFFSDISTIELFIFLPCRELRECCSHRHIIVVTDEHPHGGNCACCVQTNCFVVISCHKVIAKIRKLNVPQRNTRRLCVVKCNKVMLAVLKNIFSF